MDLELASLTDDGEVGVLLAPEELAGGRAAAFGDEGGTVALHCCGGMV